MQALDPYDIRILAAIQPDGLISHVELGQRVHLSASQAARRLDRLRKDGYIDGVVTKLNARKLGYHIMAHTLVSLKAHRLEGNLEFEQFVQRAPEVLECYAQTGDADMIMKIVVRDLEELRDFFDRLLHATGGLASLRSGIVLKTLKDSPQLAV